MFAHAHQVSMDHAANFETTAFQPHGILINSINLYKFIFLFANFLVKMVVHVIFVKVHSVVHVQLVSAVSAVKLTWLLQTHVTQTNVSMVVHV